MNANETSRGPLAQARAFEPRADALLQPAEDGALMASTSVFVVEPGSPIGKKIGILARKFIRIIFFMFFYAKIPFRNFLWNFLAQNFVFGDFF